MASRAASIGVALVIVLFFIGVAGVVTSGTPLTGAISPQQQSPQNICPEGTELLAKFNWDDISNEFVSEGGDAGVDIFNVSLDSVNDATAFNWSSSVTVEAVHVKGGLIIKSYDGGTSGFVQFGTSPAISNVIFCVLPAGTPTPTPTPTPTEDTPPSSPPSPTPTVTPTPTSTPTPTTTSTTTATATPTQTGTPDPDPDLPTPTDDTPTPTPTPTPTDDTPTPTEDTPTPTPTPTDDPETVYWQVDFGAGDAPPDPPSYWPDDLMAALGNSDDGVTENPSVLRQETAGQLQDVTIVDRSFLFDDENNPTSATVVFELDDGAETRDLHVASYVIPGPFDSDEIDQQTIHDIDVGTYSGGDTGQLTVSIPQPADE